MFGIDVLNSVPVSHLLMTENHVFNATSFDVEPTDSSKVGQYVTAKWVGEYPKNWELTFSNGHKGSGGFDNATALVNWLQNNEVGPPNHKSKGQGVRFTSLSPADAEIEAASTGGTGGSGTGGGTAKDCSLENREAVAGDTTTCGSCLSGYTEDDTGVCVADEDPADDTEDTNWLLYGGLGAVALVAVFFMKGRS